MRTTVTLDPDLAMRLKEMARERDISFRSAINTAIRAGLGVDATSNKRSYREVTRVVGTRPGVDLTKALQLASVMEDEAVAHKIALRK